MTHRTSGTSTIEVLVSLTILAIGMLGAAGTVAASLRSAHRADQTTRAVRLVGEVMVQVRSRLASAGGACGSIAAGMVNGLGGLSATWATRPARRGRAILIAIRYPAATARQEDSLWSFVQCR
jgi:Tfp pilus assembly protein PilV